MKRRDRNMPMVAGSTVSGLAGRTPNVSPSASPKRYQKAMANRIQTSADQKNQRGWGKKETNIEGRSFFRAKCRKEVGRHVKLSQVRGSCKCGAKAIRRSQIA